MKQILFLLTLNLIYCSKSLWAQQIPADSPIKKEPLYDSLRKYLALKESDKTIRFAELLVSKVEKEKGGTSKELGDALFTLGSLQNMNQNYEASSRIFMKCLDVRKVAFDAFHKEIGEAYGALGSAYFYWGYYLKSESFFQKAAEIEEKAPESEAKWKRLGMRYSDLGALYTATGKLDSAEKSLSRGLEIQKKIFGEDHQETAMAIFQLANFYLNSGNYPKAEQYYLKAIEIWKNKVAEETYVFRAAHINLGILYQQLGNYEKAEPLLLNALRLARKFNGDFHEEVAVVLTDLGHLYASTGDYSKSIKCHKEALTIYQKILDPSNPEIGKWMMNLGEIYIIAGIYSEGERYLIPGVELTKKEYGERNMMTGQGEAMLGDLYKRQGNFSVAEKKNKLALDISNSSFGQDNIQSVMRKFQLNLLYFEMGNMEKAEMGFLDWRSKKQGLIQRFFPHFSDNEKEKFYESRIKETNVFKAFCVQRYTGNKAIAADLYNEQLDMKGLLLNSSAKWKHRIKTAGDKKLNRLFDSWESNQNTLTRLLQSTDSTERAAIDSVKAKAEKMEKELSLRSENFTKLSDKKRITWKDVKLKLKPGEAAVEMIRIQKFGIENLVTDTSDPKKPVYKLKGLTDTIHYAALIVKPESVFPEMVLLKNGNDLEGKYLKFYQNSVKGKILDEKSYQYFWEKIGAKLGSSNRVYFSPDGVFHNINLNTLFNPKTKKYLLEEKDIRLVTVTKDIFNPGPAEEGNKLADLVGFPSFYANSPTASVSTTERKSPEMSYGLRLESVGTLAELPATKTEVDKIASILEGKGWEVKNYTGSNALEANIKESYKPRLLHVATHGFFQADTTKGSNPLLHSGLMLAGAGSTLKGEKNETGEDGILTAYEAMNLNLDNTDLVVLFACETGLGEVKNGEGVYGLQRAFKVAGARSIIMSLWKVDDEATQELMVSFYKHWLSAAGGNKRSAFLKAQKELKAKYPNPYYWGAFVMVGE